MNFYVQFKYKDDDHTLPNANTNTLKIVTDGTLLAELKTNPFLNCHSLEAFKKLRDLKDHF